MKKFLIGWIAVMIMLGLQVGAQADNSPPLSDSIQVQYPRLGAAIFNELMGLAYDSASKRIYVLEQLDSKNCVVKLYNSLGAFVNKISYKSSLDPDISLNKNLVVGNNLAISGNYFYSPIAGTTNNAVRIRKYSKAGNPVKGFSSREEFARLNGLACDRSGNLYAAKDYSVLKLDSRGNVLGEWSVTSAPRVIVNLSVDPSDNLLVYTNAGINAHKVYKLDPAGALVAEWPIVLSGSQARTGLAVDASNNIYVGINNEIRKLSSSGAELGSALSVSSQGALGDAELIAFGAPGKIIVGGPFQGKGEMVQIYSLSQ